MNRLGMFAKYWQPGRVKTRLACRIGDEAASSLYRRFVEVLLDRLGGQGDCRTLAYWPPERRDDFAALCGAHWQLAAQHEGTLGERIRHFFSTTIESLEDRVVLIGSDSPNLPAGYIEQAFRRLDQHPVVLGPSLDGGYYLVAARGSVPSIFEGIAWSSPAVWAQTVQQLERAGLSFAELPPWYDVDEYEDLIRLRDDAVPAGQPGEAWDGLLSAVRRLLAENSP